MASIQRQPPSDHFAAPTVAMVEKISALTEPINRNLQITYCYQQLSAAFAARTGIGANWCTFATWASKQAGQTIRREDLKRTLIQLLKNEPDIEQSLWLLAHLARQAGARQAVEQIRQSALGSLVSAVADKAGSAVSQGNKKVFEEIAREFARFITTCMHDEVYTEAHLAEFCRHLRPGFPPEGQEYLRSAFTRYYHSFFTEDPKRKAELQFLANLEIGYHEQTRLQPEIAASLNAAAVDPQQVKTRLLSLLFPQMSYWQQMRLLFRNIFQQPSVLDNAIEKLAQRAQGHLRRILTQHLMTLTLPPGTYLRLGIDLTTAYPEQLKTLELADLLVLLAQIDPTPDSLRQSGATDWASLPERMHFIADLFRCYHHSGDLFSDAFTAQQISEIKEGRVPTGPL